MSRHLAVVRSFFDDFLKDVPIERQIDHQPLQVGVLISQLPENSVDMIFSQAVLEHVDDRTLMAQVERSFNGDSSHRPKAHRVDSVIYEACPPPEPVPDP